MESQEMVDLLKQRTKVGDDNKILRELRAAQRWVARRVFNTTGGPELLSTVGLELAALSATTRKLDLAVATNSDLLGIKQLWLKLPTDERFTKMNPADATDTEFVKQDGATAANPDIAQGHPVLYAIENFSFARFAPALPAGSIIRADIFRTGPPLDPTTNPTTENSFDMPSLFHDAMVFKAQAYLFNTLDDDREASAHTNCADSINDAILNAKDRTQGPTRTKPFRVRRRRFF